MDQMTFNIINITLGLWDSGTEHGRKGKVCPCIALPVTVTRSCYFINALLTLALLFSVYF